MYWNSKESPAALFFIFLLGKKEKADPPQNGMKEGTGISPELESTVKIIQGMGFSVVEAQSRPVKGIIHVVIYIYRSGGVSLDDCTKVYRTVMPRLEVVLDSRDISLEISSPGIGRNIRFFREFAIFSGRRIRVLTEDSSEWIQGELLRADDEEIVLTVGDGERRYGRTDIVKAKISEG